MKAILNKLFKHQSLDKQEAKEVLSNLASGKYNHSQMAAFLTVYLMRSITVDELEGFRDAMLELCIRVPLDDFDTIDLCGTGGDGKDTFNISTLSSFVAAGAGLNVTKHGNYGVSSRCGSSNLLEHFGCQFGNNLDTIKKSIDEAGICFLHAPMFHPAMKNVGPVRKELGVKTFFNMLGPMVNPAFPRNQLVGVFSLELARLYGYLYQKGAANFAIVHALDGFDEVSLTGNFKMVSRHAERVLGPSALNLSKVALADLSGGETIEDSAKIFTDVLEGKGTKAQKEVVMANAGLALAVAKSIDITEGVAEARESIESGRALQSFKKFIEING